MKNVLHRKHQRNQNKYFKRKHFKKRYAPSTFSFYIPILIYQFPNGMINKICNLSTFFFINHFINNFTNSVIVSIPIVFIPNDELKLIIERIGPMATRLK